MRISGPSLAFASGLLLSSLWACSPAEQISLAIVGGTLIDGTGAGPVENAVVTVSGGSISCAGTASECPFVDAAQTLDASGRWIIPGLIDSHIHWQAWYDSTGTLSPETAARASRFYLANGITTVVDVGGQRWVKDEHRQVLDEVEPAGGPAPRMLFSGWIDRRTVDESPSQSAGSLARDLLATGVSGLKIHNGLTPAEYQEIVAEADRVGRPVYGHTYYQEGRDFIDHTAVAASTGVDGVFHVLGIPPVPEGKMPPLPSEPLEDWEAWWLAGAALWSHTTVESQESLIRLMVDHGTWLQPTLVTEQDLIDPDYFSDSPLWARSPWTREDYLAGFPRFEGEELEQYRAAYREMQAFVRRFHEAGGMLLAGTDGVPIPGVGMQEELILLVEAGIPPMVALQSATRNSARALRRGDRFGTVERGKAADLLVLDGDPLVDMENTKAIWRVVRGGSVYDPVELLR